MLALLPGKWKAFVGCCLQPPNQWTFQRWLLAGWTAWLLAEPLDAVLLQPFMWQSEGQLPFSHMLSVGHRCSQLALKSRKVSLPKYLSCYHHTRLGSKERERPELKQTKKADNFWESIRNQFITSGIKTSMVDPKKITEKQQTKKIHHISG